MGGLPEGQVTFLFTDIEGSTRLWEEAPEAMRTALRTHDDLIEQTIATHDGISVKPRGEGDSHFIVFARASDAIAAVAEMQLELADTDWPTPRPLRVRASVHTGTADLQLGDYYGPAVNRAARLRAIAHGGQTVISAPTWELVRDHLPLSVTVKDMGEHSLKDLTRPEHVYQMDVAGLLGEFPPLVSLDAIPNNLPQQLTEFVGRRGELADATKLLGQTRLLTILAPGGTGKTRLAIQAAADLTSGYPDGVFFISLAEVGTKEQIIQAIGEAIGVSYSSDEEPQDQLLTYLSSRRQLLILDNFEHVVESAGVVSAILHSAPDMTIIATSRAKLNINGETVLALTGLETVWETPEEALNTSGVRLFLDTAKRADPTFALEQEDLAGLSQILGVTGGMPLGILLAAAWVDMLPIGEIASEIAKNLDFLETEMGDIPDRHRSVRAVFDYSWDLLNPAEREVFAALSVFRGGFTRDAAEAVAGASLRSLASLVSKSLVAPSPDKGRYSVHELLRQYAEAELKADSENCEEILDAHAAFYTEAASAYDLFYTSNQPEFLSAVESDIENMRSAWRHSLSRRDAESVRKMIIVLQILHEIRGWYTAGHAFFEEALDTFPSYTGDELSDSVRALSSAAQTYYKALLGQPDAETVLEASDKLRQTSDQFAHWFSLQSVALNMSYLGRLEDMVTCTEEMISVGEGLEHPVWQFGGNNWRSLAAIQLEDVGSARQLLPPAMEVFERYDEHYFMTWNLWLQALIATIEERPDEAILLLARQVVRCQQIKYRRGTMVGLEALGQAHTATDDLDAAERAFTEGLAEAEKAAMVPDMLGMMVKIARVRAEKGRQEEAVSLLATVIADPLSERQTMSDTISIIDMANGALDEIRGEFDGEAFAAAQRKGSAVPYEVAAKQLLQSLY